MSNDTPVAGCPGCHQRQPVNRNGRVRAHNGYHGRCGGSGQEPTTEARTRDNWAELGHLVVRYHDTLVPEERDRVRAGRCARWTGDEHGYCDRDRQRGNAFCDGHAPLAETDATSGEAASLSGRRHGAGIAKRVSAMGTAAEVEAVLDGVDGTTLRCIGRQLDVPASFTGHHAVRQIADEMEVRNGDLGRMVEYYGDLRAQAAAGARDAPEGYEDARAGIRVDRALAVVEERVARTYDVDGAYDMMERVRGYGEQRRRAVVAGCDRRPEDQEQASRRAVDIHARIAEEETLRQAGASAEPGDGDGRTDGVDAGQCQQSEMDDTGTPTDDPEDGM
jgi:hypothetical protein